MEDQQPHSSKSSMTITFTCHSCNKTISATVSEFGKIYVCLDCNAENLVPLPKLKVGGGLAGDQRKPKVGAPNEIIPSTQNKGIESKKPETPDGTPPTTTISKTPPHREQIEKFEEKEEKSKKLTTNSLIVAAVLFLVSLGIGLLATNWGSELYAKLTQSSSVVITQPNIEHTRIGPDQLKDILGYWTAAQLANETIETDLKISLTEMEKLGMVDQADAVRHAIEMKKESIAESRDRYALAMTDIAMAYKQEEAEVKELFDKFSSSQSIRSNPRAVEFLKMSLDSLQEVPSQHKEYKIYFAEKFNALGENNFEDVTE